jgi:hypothetical protein
VNRFRISEEIQKALRAYVAGEHPYPFGDFVTAVLANDFVEVVLRADDHNVEILPDYASYLYNMMPGRTGDPTKDFWGSREAVGNRIKEQRAAYEKAHPELAAD